MIRPLTLIFLVLTFLTLTHESQPQNPLNNLRNLASTDSSSSSSIQTYDLIKYGKNFAINVDLGDDYLKRTNMTRKNETAMVVLLYTSATAFCRTCLETVEYDCTNNSCQADKTVKQTFFSLHYAFKEAYPINQTVMIGGSTHAPWSLATNPSLHSFDGTVHNHVWTESSFEYYINNKSTYGILGLGLDKGNAANFKADHPLFSLSINYTGSSGQLIFGKNSSLYNPSSTPIVLPTDANWTMITQNITFGSNYSNNTFASDIIFDLQYPGIGIPYRFWSDHWAPTDFKRNLEKNYNVKQNNSFGIEGYPYTYYGNLSNLPNLTITLTNNQTIIIPPSAYTRKSDKANDTYSLLFDRTDLIREKSWVAEGRLCTVLGWPVLAHFYAIFEQKNGSQPTITLYPAITPKASESLFSSLIGTRIAQGIAFVGVLIVVYVCYKKRAAAKLEDELGEELRPTTRLLKKEEGGEYHRL